MKTKISAKSVFWSLAIAILLFVFGTYFIKLLRGSFFLIIIALIFLLAVALVFLTIKQKVKGLLKKFLILTGGSAVGFFISVMLHNFLYALGIISENIFILKQLFEVLNVAFFLIAIFVCPITFLIGFIGTIVLFFKKK